MWMGKAEVGSKLLGVGVLPLTGIGQRGERSLVSHRAQVCAIRYIARAQR